jgi:transposase InsO family protein
VGVRPLAHPSPRGRPLGSSAVELTLAVAIAAALRLVRKELGLSVRVAVPPWLDDESIEIALTVLLAVARTRAERPSLLLPENGFENYLAESGFLDEASGVFTIEGAIPAHQSTPASALFPISRVSLAADDSALERVVATLARLLSGRAHIASGPDQVWSWDITFLKTPVRGRFVYLYLLMDVWSRKIVGWNVYAVESAALAATLITDTGAAQRLDPRGIVLHADNGGPMKGATMLVTVERLGVLASFSRPRMSNDNPFSEAFFHTLKNRPEYPTQPFADLAAARAWVATVVRWYNTAHLHRAIRFVTLADRHAGRDTALLRARQAVYDAARDRHPERWGGDTRNWTPIAIVTLNPERVAESSTRHIAA